MALIELTVCEHGQNTGKKIEVQTNQIETMKKAEINLQDQVSSPVVWFTQINFASGRSISVVEPIFRILELERENSVNASGQ